MGKRIGYRLCFTLTAAHGNRDEVWVREVFERLVRDLDLLANSSSRLLFVILVLELSKCLRVGIIMACCSCRHAHDKIANDAG